MPQNFKRMKDICTICGNGPSLLKYTSEITDHDIITMNTGIFLNMSPSIYIYEPIPMISHNTTHAFGQPGYLNDNFDYEAILRIIFYAMSEAATNISPSKILVNPNQDIMGYINPLRNFNSCRIPAFFSFNEEEKTMYGYWLLHFFRNLASNHVLNFRGSIIRALSIALTLRYPVISFTGLDPSRYKYWWEEESAISFISPSHRHLEDHFNAITKLRPINQVKYDSEVGLFANAPMSFCLRITLLAAKRIAQEKNKKFPSIIYYGNDPIIFKALSGII